MNLQGLLLRLSSALHRGLGSVGVCRDGHRYVLMCGATKATTVDGGVVLSLHLTPEKLRELRGDIDALLEGDAS